MLAASDLNNELIARYKLWLSALDYSIPTQRRYPRIVREFCQSAGTKAVIRTTPWDVRKFLIEETRRGLRYGTVRDLLVVLRNFSEFLGLGGMRGRIPVQTIQMRAAPRNPPDVVSPRTIFRLIAAARNPRDVALLELLYATGCRAKELMNVKVEDIDFESRKIRVKGKNKRARYVLFGAKAAGATKAYLRGRNSGYLFQSALLQRGCIYACSRRGQWIGKINVLRSTHPPVSRVTSFSLGSRKDISLREAWVLFRKRRCGLKVVPAKVGPMHTATVRRTLTLLALQAGIKNVIPRTIRHCFATHMLDGGADIREIQELMGHAHLTSTQIYTHVSREKLVKAFNRCHPRGDRNHAEFKSRAT